MKKLNHRRNWVPAGITQTSVWQGVSYQMSSALVMDNTWPKHIMLYDFTTSHM
jgi:hypothetical protein